MRCHQTHDHVGLEGLSGCQEMKLRDQLMTIGDNAQQYTGENLSYLQLERIDSALRNVEQGVTVY